MAVSGSFAGVAMVVVVTTNVLRAPCVVELSDGAAGGWLSLPPVAATATGPDPFGPLPVGTSFYNT